MHPRNPYQNPPDFKELALKFPDFRKHAKQKLSGKVAVDFTDPASVRALTTVLLKKDFGLEVELPTDRLIPTLPLRLNYLLWVEDMMNLIYPSTEKKDIHGIDVGTGACCIYSLLGAVKFKWHFLATETDEANFNCAAETVKRNGLGGFIQLLKVAPETIFLDNIKTDIVYDFTMCNPPFFDSDNLGPKSRSNKRPQPICPKSGGSCLLNEIAVRGGEIKFIELLIQESMKLKNNVRIFSTMVGCKASLAPLKKLIEKAKATFCTTTEFHQGRTCRWGIAWTYEEIPLPKLENLQPNHVSKKMPSSSAFVVNPDLWIDHEYSVTCIMAKIIEHLNNLKMHIKSRSESKSRRVAEFTAKENTWSNMRRKRRAGKYRASEIIVEPTSSTSFHEPEAKKHKTDPRTETVLKGDDFFLKGLVIVQKSQNNDTISFQLQWLNGGAGKDSINQILQYLKNSLFTGQNIRK